MAKRKSAKDNKQKKQSRPARKIEEKKTASPKTYLVRPPVTSENDASYKKMFKWLSIGLGIIMVLMALNSGINGDDEYQNDYSKKLVNYYATMGADTSALHIEKGKMHLYGGFFDLTTGVVNSALGNEVYDAGYHDVRHIFNALFGILLMVFTALLAKEIAGWRAALLVLVFCFLSPRLLGHSLMNPKDIPFAAGFSISLYYMTLLFKNMPKPNWKILLGLALGMALAISSRAGGLLLVAYLGLFAGIDFLMKYGIKGVVGEWKVVMKYAGYILGTTLLSFILAMLFWPYALVDPINHPMEALDEFAKLGVKIRLLFQGENIMSDSTAWHYSISWIWRTIPIFTLIGLLGSLVVLPKLLKRYHILPILLCWFAAIFPIAYVIAKDSIIHDGWRHLMFVYPPMVILAGLFWIHLEDRFKENNTLKSAMYGVLGLFLIESGLFIARNISMPYVYFNTISGGINNAFGEYETDYWGVSVKQAVSWLEDQGIIKEGMEEPITIGTSYLHNLRVYVAKKYDGKVKTVYVRPNQRYDKEWDYGIFPSRYIRGAHLRNDTWPNSKSVHTVYANGVPITTIEKSETKYAFEGEKALKAKDFPKAIELFQKEVAQYPDNEIAWVKLAIANANVSQFPAVLEAADKVLGIAPDNVNALYYKAIANLNMGKKDEAFMLFDKATRIDDVYAPAYYYMAVIQMQDQDLEGALKNALAAIEKNPKLGAAYDLAASIFEKVGNTEKANQVKALKARIQ